MPPKIGELAGRVDLRMTNAREALTGDRFVDPKALERIKPFKAPAELRANFDTLVPPGVTLESFRQRTDWSLQIISDPALSAMWKKPKSLTDTAHELASNVPHYLIQPTNPFTPITILAGTTISELSINFAVSGSDRQDSQKIRRPDSQMSLDGKGEDVRPPTYWNAGVSISDFRESAASGARQPENQKQRVITEIDNFLSRGNAEAVAAAVMEGQLSGELLFGLAIDFSNNWQYSKKYTAAISALAKAAKNDDVYWYTSLLNHPYYPDTISTALDVLTEMGDKRAIPAILSLTADLSSYYKEYPELYFTYSHSVGTLYGGPQEAFEVPDYANRIKVLGNLGSALRRFLDDLTDEDIERLISVYSLGSSEREQLPGQLELPDMKALIIYSIGKRADPTFAPIIIADLMNDKYNSDWEWRPVPSFLKDAILYVLKQHYPEMLSRVENKIRGAFLAALKGERAFPSLTLVRSREMDYSILKRLCDELEQLAAPRSANDDIQIMGMNAEELETFYPSERYASNPEAVQMLINWVKGPGSGRIVWGTSHAMAALARIGTREALEFLSQIPDKEVRRAERIDEYKSNRL